MMQFIDLAKQQKIIRDKIDVRIAKVLNHGQFIMGPEVYELEKQLSQYVGIDYCITCSSGTDALLIPLLAHNISVGDAVITSPFTYIATAEVIRMLGATPIFIDIDPNTYNINPEKIPLAIEEAKKKSLNPKAIIPVDLFGLPADHITIGKYAREYNLFYIDDAAQGFGGEIKGKKVCSFGDVSATSFFPAKPLGCYGDGGAIFTSDETLAQKMNSIRIHGSGNDKYENVRLGINGRLDTIQAAILLEKLLIFPEEIQKRNEIANYYSSNLNNKYILPKVYPGFLSSWAQYSILAANSNERSAIVDYLKSNNIPSMIYYKLPLHLQEVFSDLGYNKGDFPVTEDCSSRIFSIPMHPYLDFSELNTIIELLNLYE